MTDQNTKNGNSNEKCVAIMLSDDPSKEDKFQGGAHARLAYTISELIKTDANGGKVIGLDGNWGTGKSTVIELLKDNLEGKDKTDKDKYHVFQYDTWEFEGDPLRINFLVKLAEDINENKKGWFKNTPDINKVIDNIAGTHIELIKEKPDIWLVIIVLISAVLLSVLGNFILDAQKGCTPLLPSSICNLNGLFLLGFFLNYLVPVAAFFILQEYYKEFGIQIPFAILQFIGLKNIPDINNKQREPNSIEFKKAFDRIVNQCLEANERKLIIVIDNLDRINPEKALSILSTLNIFTECNNSPCEDIENSVWNRLWIIIPYDREGLEKLWENSSRNNDHSVAISMINKMFQIRFFVPPLVLSNWQDYFSICLKEAFPNNHNDIEYFQTLKVYTNCIIPMAQSKNSKVDKSSPRDIKLFINQMGAIHRQWDSVNTVEHFPLHHIAYFVFLKLKEEYDPNNSIKNILLHKNFIEKNLIDIFEDNTILRNHLVTMYFGVEENLAYQHLLRPTIEDLILNRNFEDFATLEAVHQDVFWRVLDTIDVNSENLIPIYNLAFCIYKSELINNTKHIKYLEPLKKKLWFSTTSLRYINSFDETTALGMGALILIINQDDYGKNLIQSIPFPRTEVSTEDINEHIIKIKEIKPIYSNFIDKLKKLFEIVHPRYRDEKLISVQLNKYEFIELFAQISDQYELFNWFDLKSVPSKDEITDGVCKLINEGAYEKEYLNAIAFFLHENIQVDWAKIIDSLTDRLSKENFNFVGEMLETMWLLRSKPDVPNISDYVDKKLDTITIQKAHVLHHLYDCNREDYKDSYGAAWCLFIYIYKVTDVRPPDRNQTVGHSENGYKMVLPLFNEKLNDIFDEFYKIIEKYKAMEVLFKITTMNKDTRPMSGKVLRRIISEHQDNLIDYLPIDKINKYWISIFLLLGNDEFEKFIRKVINKHRKFFFDYENNLSPDSRNYLGWLEEKVKQLENDKTLEKIKNGITEDEYNELDSLKNRVNKSNNTRLKH